VPRNDRGSRSRLCSRAARMRRVACFPLRARWTARVPDRHALTWSSGSRQQCCDRWRQRRFRCSQRCPAHRQTCCRCHHWAGQIGCSRFALAVASRHSLHSDGPTTCRLTTHCLTTLRPAVASCSCCWSRTAPRSRHRCPPRLLVHFPSRPARRIVRHCDHRFVMPCCSPVASSCLLLDADRLSASIS
jgi:hypothetical protein